MRSRCITLAWSAALLALGSCGGDSAGETRAATTTSARPQLGPLTASKPLRLGADLLKVRHGGLRQIELLDWTVQPPKHVVFREQIVTDGAGNYSIEPYDAVSGVEPNWMSFELLQRVREGFIFRYRDFVIRDSVLFHQNYHVTDLGLDVTVAGRLCHLYDVEREIGQGGAYELAVDDGTGMILRYREYDSDDRLIASLEYQTYETDPDLGVSFHEASNSELELDLGGDLAQQVDATVLMPTLLPQGYALRSAAMVSEAGGEAWLKLTFVDGVEPLFFLHALQQNRLGAEQPAEVVLFPLGVATVAQGQIGGNRVIAVGKVPAQEILDLIESSLP